MVVVVVVEVVEVVVEVVEGSSIVSCRDRRSPRPV